jgi:hypothetical protein
VVPPGCLGHRENKPLITQEALAASHRAELKLSFLLSAEIEKASDVLGQLLGMLNKASIETKVGRSPHRTLFFLSTRSPNLCRLIPCFPGVCGASQSLRSTSFCRSAPLGHAFAPQFATNGAKLAAEVPAVLDGLLLPATSPASLQIHSQPFSQS